MSQTQARLALGEFKRSHEIVKASMYSRINVLKLRREYRVVVTMVDKTVVL